MTTTNIETGNFDRYMRFERIDGEAGEFWEIYAHGWRKIWLCEGTIGTDGTNSHLSKSDLGSWGDGVFLKKVSNLVIAKEKAGFIYVGDVEKIIDDRYRSALMSQDPRELLDCLKDGYSPFSVVTNKNDSVTSTMEIAIAASNIEAIKILVEAGCSIDRPPKWKDSGFHSSNSPLIFALGHTNSCEVIQLLLELGASAKTQWGNESTPLHYAKSADQMKLLIEHGANVDTPGRYGQSPLHRLLNYSTTDPTLEMSKILIKCKAEINTRDVLGDTPLITAAEQGNHDAVQLLLENGADLNACNKNGKNALVEAISRSYGASRTNTIQILLTAGMDPNLSIKDGVTVLMAACESKAAASDINLLLSAGADINAKDKKGKTALMRVVNTSVPMVKFLIKAGANIDLQDSTGKTAAMIAALPEPRKKWKATALTLLINSGANLSVKDKRGRGVLQTNSSEAAIILLDAGAVPNAVDGESLLSLAITQDNLTLILKILEKGTYRIKPDDLQYIKNKLSGLITKIVAVNPSLLRNLTCNDAEVQALIEKHLEKALAAPALDYALDTDLPDILQPGAWPSTGQDKAPELPSFWNARVHPSPVLLSSSKPLPPQAVDTIARMVLMSTYDAPIPEIAQVTAVFERQSLANFALSIFQDWADKGNKGSDGLFQVLAYWGDKKAARTLTPLIQHWPKVQLSQRAAMGLEILGAMGSDIALTQIHAIAAKTKYDSVRIRAEALLQKVASARNLSAEQLEDRLVPSLDLSDDGSMKLDFGNRSFVASVNELLQPILTDAKGSEIKALPKAAITDNPGLAAESAEKWREFKKQLKAVAGIQLARFEQGMSNSRRWSGEEFNNFLVNHPLLQKAVRRLVWAIYDQGAMVSTFAFQSDGTAIDVSGRVFVVKADACIGVPHPLDMAGAIEAWKDVFQKSKQAQPFPQLVRKTYLKTEDIDGTRFGLEGLVVPSLAFKGLKSLGWDRQGDTFAGTFDALYRRFPSGTASITVSPGLNLAAYDALSNEQTISIAAEGLAVVDFSELIRELQTLKA